MLQLMRRGRCEEVRPLSAGEDKALRRAFGRYSNVFWRDAGAHVVRQYQGALGGQWFACDCKGAASPPPVLVPVAETHVRRHVEGPWPEHAVWCDFYREPAEQAAVSASYRLPAPSQTLNLLRAYRTSQPEGTHLSSVSRQDRRPKLARVLFDLMESARLNRVETEAPRRLSEQFAALRGAAAERWLDADVRLDRFLCTYTPALPELVTRIENAPERRFPGTRRPHGLLIGVAQDVRQGWIQPVSGEPFSVFGEIKICAEKDGHAGGRHAAIGARAPYLMVCLVGRPQPEDPVQVLRAYLHPCWSQHWLFPVDSNYERQTLRQLVSLRRWMEEKRGIAVSIHKPLFDMRPQILSLAEGDNSEPIIPDFLVEAGARTVVVETMGYDLPAYRVRKARLHADMAQLRGGSTVIEHDFCLSVEMSQGERDNAFWRACRAAFMSASGLEAA